MSPLALVATLGIAISAQAQTTALYLDSQPGDPLGGGAHETYTLADATFQITAHSNNAVNVFVRDSSLSFWWYLDFVAPANTPLAIGSYHSVRRFATATNGGLDVSGSGRGCGQVTGRFDVREIVFGPDNTVLAFAADFEQHCEDANPALFGAVRYNSIVASLQPFDGNYPFYQLIVTPPDHGRITATSAANIDCGGSGATCVFTPSVATELVLTAVPDAGYAFAGWTGD